MAIGDGNSADSVRRFYDGLAGDYHLIFEDWRRSVNRQGEVLDLIIRRELGDRTLDVLDCSCGIGTQAIGLATRGHRVTASDMSEASIGRARLEMGSFGVSLDLAVADFRELKNSIRGDFDVVVACDNSLSHMLNDSDLARAAESILAKLRPGGLVLASTRDYDKLLRVRPRATMPEVFDEGDRVVFQVWHWDRSAPIYRLDLFIVCRSDSGWETRRHIGECRAIRRDDMTSIFEASGFRATRWQMPSQSGFYQPVMTARRK